jgi:hypothetical protein
MQKPKWLENWKFQALDAILSAALGSYLLFDGIFELSDWKLTWYGVVFVLFGPVLFYMGLNKLCRLATHRS